MTLMHSVARNDSDDSDDTPACKALHSANFNNYASALRGDGAVCTRMNCSREVKH